MKRVNFLTVITTLGFICLVIWSFPLSKCRDCYLLSEVYIKLAAYGIVFLLGGIYFSLEFLKTEDLIFQIDSLPLLKTTQATEGIWFCGEGEVFSKHVFKSPYTKTNCVFSHSIKEKRSRDHWIAIEDRAIFVPFYLKDDKGKILIDLRGIDEDFSGFKLELEDENQRVQDPKNSEIDAEPILKKETFVKTKKLLGLPVKKEYYRLSEYVLKPKTKIFACGKIFKEDGELVLREGKNFPLIISRKTKEQYVSQFYKGKDILYWRHLLLSAGFSLFLAGIGNLFRLKEEVVFVLLVFGNFIFLGSVIFTIYNRIITLKNRALNALSNIDIELERKNKLIPAIVELVKFSSKYELLQKKLAQLREKVSFSETLPEYPQNYTSLFSLIERFPVVKAGKNFEELMEDLIETEERILQAREFYNRSVRKYNTLIAQFPFNLISFIFSFKPLRYLSFSYS